MAQQARPHWYTQSEYLRLMFKRAVRGLGTRPFSTRPISATPARPPLAAEVAKPAGSHPPQDALAPGVHEPEHEHEHENEHLDEPVPPVGVQLRGPREDEHRLHVEDDEQEGEHVVADH